MKKQTLSVFTAATVAASVVVPVASANTSFTDVSPSSSHFNAIQNLVERGIIKGFEDNTYRPNATLTRGQAAKILANALQLDTSSKEQKFTDVTASIEYIGAINALADKGIINGYADGTFKPGEPLTRGQMAKILVNAFGLEEANEVNLPFTDVSAQNGYKGFIQTLLNYEITEGTTSTTFSPSAAVKRGQMASFVVRAENAKQAPTADQNTIQSTIVAVEEGKIILESGTYEVSESLQKVLAPYNATALQNAEITATVEAGKIVDVTALTIITQGTEEQPIVLKSSASDAVASITPIAATTSKVSFGGVVTVASNFVQFKGIEFTNEVILTSAVKLFSFNELLEKLTINQDVEATINGTSNVNTIVVASEKSLHLNITGTVSILSFATEKAAVKLALTTKIKNIVTPNNVTLESIISNYSAVKGNITNVNGSTPQSPSTGSGNNGGGSISTSTPPTTGGNEKPTNPETPPTTDEEEKPTNPGTEKPVIPTVPKTELEPKPIAPIGTEFTGVITSITTSDSATTTGDTAETTTEDSTTTTVDTIRVHFDTNSFEVADEKLAYFIRNNEEALLYAGASFIVNDGKIIGIKDLYLTRGDELNGDDGQDGRITIYGNVTVAKQTATVQNIIIGGDVILPSDYQDELIFNKVKIYGTVAFSEMAVAATRQLIASLTPIAAATTKIKITFNDSSVAIIEINKEDVALYAGGTTEVAEINVKSNTTIDAEGVIFPKIVLSPGATNVVINASIKNVVIESDEQIVVTGRGNFDHVEVNTAAPIELKTEGNIKSLAAKNEDTNLTLGNNVKIDVVATNKPIEEIIKNHADVKTQIGQTTDLNYYFAVELIQNYKDLGYYSLKLANVGDHQVKYDFVTIHSDTSHIKRGQLAPENAISYEIGKEVFIPGDKTIIVYLVDSNNKIVDFDTSLNTRFSSFKFTTTTAGMQLDTTYEVTNGTKVSDTFDSVIRYKIGEPIIYLTATELEVLTWKVTDGVATVLLPINGVYDQFESKHHSLIWLGKLRDGVYLSTSGENEKTDQALVTLKDIAAKYKETPEENKAISDIIGILFYHYNIDKGQLFINKEKVPQYIEAIKSVTTLGNLYDRIVEINKEEN